MCMYCVIALAGFVGVLKLGSDMLKAKKANIKSKDDTV